MKRILSTIALVLLGTMGLSAAAQADLITVNFTGDNVTNGGVCTEVGCPNPIWVNPLFSNLGTPNANNWTAADSVSFELGAGTHWIAFRVTNDGAGSSGNPAGFLAEILWGGNVNSSSVSWDVSADAGINWFTATSYGSNGEAGVIWTTVNGGPIAGIGTAADWLWTGNNANANMDQTAWFRTSIRVPEPGTLALLGIGLFGMGLARRRKEV